MVAMWLCAWVLVSFKFWIILALPAQKYSPGIPIKPTVNQTPGEISGIISESSSGSAVVSSQTYTEAADGTPIVIQSQASRPSATTQHVPKRQQVILDSDSSYYPSPQYVGQSPVAYVYPDGTYASKPSSPVQSVTRFGNDYHSSPASNYVISGPPGEYYPRPSGPTSYLSSSINRHTVSQALGALGALGTTGILGAGALGAGALLLG
ncbi:uncharacterized protein LOC134215275 isoform X2 [Armigeres subalbatus]|uniref:uncharacterized protein LOC134215275 isoform X2 n=1 Tax=Armigeres subalbatus TaxID=124917 RepID=UPI002ED620A1